MKRNEIISRYVTNQKKLLEKLRITFADYVTSEGCGCCKNNILNDKASLKLGKSLDAEMYKDNSGVNWNKYKSNK